ncbi:MAG: glycosyltransferase, partial [Spirochaetales bacterium]|nr:glycosyltransferase [Candidatus Physcosoma equi]
LVESVSAADELWVVSKGAGENIRSLGYNGDYIVMENGVDLPRGRASEEEILEAITGYDLPHGVPVFLFVGRLMWYKGLRIILDALAALASQNMDFRMVFIGGGGDEVEVKTYAEKLGLKKKCIFTGKIYDGMRRVAWYSFADPFLFPSTFDTNGLVVREAAACSLGTVMVGGSCASEGVTNGVNGLFIEENAASLAVCLSRIMDDKSRMRRIGENAARDLYISWDTAVAKAVDRYEVVMENHKAGHYVDKRKKMEKVFTLSGEVLDAFDKLNQHFARNEEK